MCYPNVNKSSTFISLLHNRHKLGANVGQIFNALTNNFLYDKIKIEDMDVDKLKLFENGRDNQK